MDLDTELRHTRGDLKRFLQVLADIDHAVDHAQNPDTVHNLIAQLSVHVSRRADSITEVLDA